MSYDLSDWYKYIVTAFIRVGTNDNRQIYETVSNVKNMLGIHEYLGHEHNCTDCAVDMWNLVQDKTCIQHRVIEPQQSSITY